MHIRSIVAIALLALVAACAPGRADRARAGASGASPDTINRLLPGTEIHPWTPIDRRLSYDASTLSDFIDGGAEAFLDYGFARAVSREYSGGGESVVCTVYEMRDAEAAFGIFSSQRSPGRQRLAIGDDADRSEGQLVFWQMRYYVTLETYTPHGAADRALDAFARFISGRIGSRSGLPAVMSRLPRQWLQPMTDRLLKGRAATNALAAINSDAAAWTLGADAAVVSGDYQTKAGSYRLLVVVAGTSRGVNDVQALPARLFTPAAGYARAVASTHGMQNISLWTRHGRTFASQPIGAGVRLVVDATRLEDAQPAIAGGVQR